MSRIGVAIVLVIVLVVGIGLNRVQDDDEEFLRMRGVAEKYGFPIQSYKFFTDSGYLVGLSRISR